jgi:hypothetical protein
MLSVNGHIGKNKPLSRFKSCYFDIDFKRHSIKPKFQYKIQPEFQKNLCRQLKKGLYKVFLEELERQKSSAHDKRYDFIRGFCRHDIGDYPVFYFIRQYGVIMLTDNWIKFPEFFLEKDQQFKYLISNDKFFEFELLGHVFGIVTEEDWTSEFHNYIKSTSLAKQNHFKGISEIKRFDDVDFTLSILDS